MRQRVIAYAFGGYLSRKPGHSETITGATALTLNTVLGLATFRMLYGLDRVGVPPAPGLFDVRLHPSGEPAILTVLVLLFTDDGTPAARGQVTGEIDLERQARPFLSTRTPENSG